MTIDLADRRELFLDSYLIDAMEGGLTQRLHQPTPREIVFTTDQPWEGNMCGYVTVFRDGDIVRMYYKAWQMDLTEGKITDRHGMQAGYAESTDGRTFTRPKLGHVPGPGEGPNNLVWAGQDGYSTGAHGFSPFRDDNPACPPDQRYKAVGIGGGDNGPNLRSMLSPDGIHWRLAGDKPIITRGKFDSHNLVFWDALRGEYRAYVRDFHNHPNGRDVRTATSPDFVNWTDPVWLDHGDAPPDQLYTNNILPYYRAPHLFVGFPARYVERPWTATMEGLPELEHRRLRSSVSMRYGTALSDGVFMSSRDGRVFKRWGEAFIRPGPAAVDNWTYGDNYPGWGIIETPSDIAGAPPELSVYTSEGYWRNDRTFVRRHSLRLDGFVSVHADRAGGQLTTPPLTFEGDRLTLNLSTSAAGCAHVEIADAEGKPLPGYTFADCPELVGDTIDYPVRWADGPDVSSLRGRPVRLRIRLSDADLYALRFVS